MKTKRWVRCINRGLQKPEPVATRHQIRLIALPEGCFDAVSGFVGGAFGRAWWG